MRGVRGGALLPLGAQRGPHGGRLHSKRQPDDQRPRAAAPGRRQHRPQLHVGEVTPRVQAAVVHQRPARERPGLPGGAPAPEARARAVHHGAGPAARHPPAALPRGLHGAALRGHRLHRAVALAHRGGARRRAAAQRAHAREPGGLLRAEGWRWSSPGARPAAAGPAGTAPGHLIARRPAIRQPNPRYLTSFVRISMCAFVFVCDCEIRQFLFKSVWHLPSVFRTPRPARLREASKEPKVFVEGKNVRFRKQRLNSLIIFLKV